MHNKAHHSLPLVAGTSTRYAARRPCALRYGRLTRWKGGGDVVYMALL